MTPQEFAALPDGTRVVITFSPHPDRPVRDPVWFVPGLVGVVAGPAILGSHGQRRLVRFGEDRPHLTWHHHVEVLP